MKNKKGQGIARTKRKLMEGMGGESSFMERSTRKQALAYAVAIREIGEIDRGRRCLSQLANVCEIENMKSTGLNGVKNRDRPNWIRHVEEWVEEQQPRVFQPNLRPLKAPRCVAARQT